MDGDELELELDRLHKASFGWALRCCAWNPAEAEDVLQIAYLKILEGKARFDGRSSLKTWLFAIIRRTAMEQRRRAFFRDLLLRKFNSRNGSSPDPVQATPDSLTFQLKKLPTRQQEVLDLVFYHDMTIEEAARVMGVSVGTARTHYSRGKLSLRRVLEGTNTK